MAPALKPWNLFRKQTKKNAQYASQNSFKGKVLPFFTRAQFKKKDTSPFIQILFFSSLLLFGIKTPKWLILVQKNILNHTGALEIRVIGAVFEGRLRTRGGDSSHAKNLCHPTAARERRRLFFFPLRVFTGSCKHWSPVALLYWTFSLVFFFIFFFLIIIILSWLLFPAHEWCCLLVGSMHVWIGVLRWAAQRSRGRTFKGLKSVSCCCMRLHSIERKRKMAVS